MDNESKPCFIKAVKFNDEYFEHGGIISVATKKGEEITGRLIMNGRDRGGYTCKEYLALDISENFCSNRAFIRYDEIEKICRVNSGNA